MTKLTGTLDNKKTKMTFDLGNGLSLVADIEPADWDDVASDVGQVFNDASKLPEWSCVYQNYWYTEDERSWKCKKPGGKWRKPSEQAIRYLEHLFSSWHGTAGAYGWHSDGWGGGELKYAEQMLRNMYLLDRQEVSAVNVVYKLTCGTVDLRPLAYCDSFVYNTTSELETWITERVNEYASEAVAAAWNQLTTMLAAINAARGTL